MTKLLVVGYGSIGARHARIAAEFGIDVRCVTGNAACPFPVFTDLRAALAEPGIDHVVVANATDDHEATLRTLRDSGWTGSVLMEKPLFARPVDPAEFAGMTVVVGFNLRAHPLIRRLREVVGDRPLYSAEFGVGQYLPSWRPDQDYRTGYSASRARGGGALRDLSHEIDLATHFCGPIDRLVALGGHVSDLEIDSDDVYRLLAESRRCPIVGIHMDYLARMPRRIVVLHGRGFSAELNLVRGELIVDGTVETARPDRDLTYREQLQRFVEGDHAALCSLLEATHVDSVVDCAERSVAERAWVTVTA